MKYILKNRGMRALFLLSLVIPTTIYSMKRSEPEGQRIASIPAAAQPAKRSRAKVNPLSQAIRNRDVAGIETHLQNTKLLWQNEIKDFIDLYPIYYAINNGDAALVRKIFATRAAITPEIANRAFVLACIRGHREIAALFLQSYPAVVEAKIEQHFLCHFNFGVKMDTLLGLAALSGNRDLVTFLAGNATAALTDTDMRTILSSNAPAELIIDLLKADKATLTDSGAIMAWIHGNRAALIDFAFNEEIALDGILFGAARKNDKTFIVRARERYEDKKAADHIIFSAAYLGGHVDLMTETAARGLVDINAPLSNVACMMDLRGVTPLGHTVQRIDRGEQWISILIDQFGADPNAWTSHSTMQRNPVGTLVRTVSQRTPFFIAVLCGALARADLLLNKGARMYDVQDLGQVPCPRGQAILTAIIDNNRLALEYLLIRGAELPPKEALPLPLPLSAVNPLIPLVHREEQRRKARFAEACVAGNLLELEKMIALRWLTPSFCVNSSRPY